MGTTKESIFAEFLSEEAFQSEGDVEVPLQIIKSDTIRYKLPVSSAISDEELKIQWRSIRNFFRTGKQGGNPFHGALTPVLLADYLAAREIITDYPVYLSEGNADNTNEMKAEHCSFNVLLYQVFNQTFKEGEAKILLKYLPRIEKFTRKYVTESDNFCLVKPALEAALKDLRKVKVSGEDGIVFLKDIEIYKKKLPQTGVLLGFSQKTPILILGHLLKFQNLNLRKNFLVKVHRLKSALNDLISVEKSNKSKDQNLDFAGSLIQFDKLNDLMPVRSSELMNEKRSSRINNCIKVMESAENLLIKNEALAFIGSALAESKIFNWEQLLTGIAIKHTPPDESCMTAANGFKHHIEGLTKLIASVRIAELELQNKFDEEIHGEYFSRFNYNYFTEEETELCPPVVLIEETPNLLGRELHHFSSLISSSKPVKVLAINRAFPYKINQNGQEDDQMFIYQQELSALAISHRGAFTHQGTAGNPLHLINGFQSGLESSTPALFHVLIPADLNNSTNRHFLELSSSVEGRQFPVFTYNARGQKWGSRFDINANPQPDRNWPKYTVEIIKDSVDNSVEPLTLEIAFTYADFSALDNTNSKNLMIVPPSCWTDDLIPMSDFLELSSDELYAKVPYIWLADNEKTLYRAAVPYSIVLAAKERLDFWNFIQELGGINSYHVEKAVTQSRLEMQEKKDLEIRNLELAYEKKIEEVRYNAAGEAMNKLAGILLDLDSISTSPSAKNIENSTLNTGAGAGLPEDASDTGSRLVEAGEKEPAVSNEPWVETFRCTSCNECTDKYPRAFKYDSEKQAYLEDPTTITFAQMVKAAEACPAKCIHPGMPLNPNEPGLDELISRARIYN